MSIEALRWALDEGQDRELDPPRRHILLILGNRADERGYCFPSIRWICIRTGYARRTVQMHMKALEEAGLLRRDTRPDGRGGRTSDAVWLGLRQPGLPMPDPRADFALGGRQSDAPPAVDVHEGGAPRAPKKKEYKKEVKTPSGQATASPVSQCFEAYRQGMKVAYGVEYPPSASANGILAQVVKTLGAEPALAVARAFVASKDPWYVKVKHDLKYLRRDCTRLWVELQQRSGGAERPATEAAVAIEWADGKMQRMQVYPVDAPERIARQLLNDYASQVPRWTAKNVVVDIGRTRSRYSIEELRSRP